MGRPSLKPLGTTPPRGPACIFFAILGFCSFHFGGTFPPTYFDSPPGGVPHQSKCLFSDRRRKPLPLNLDTQSRVRGGYYLGGIVWARFSKSSRPGRLLFLAVQGFFLEYLWFFGTFSDRASFLVLCHFAFTEVLMGGVIPEQGQPKSVLGPAKMSKVPSSIPVQR